MSHSGDPSRPPDGAGDAARFIQLKELFETAVALPCKSGTRQKPALGRNPDVVRQ